MEKKTHRPKITHEIISKMSSILNQYVTPWIVSNGGWNEVTKEMGKDQPSLNVAGNLERIIEAFSRQTDLKNVSSNLSTNGLWPTLICLLLMILTSHVHAAPENMMQENFITAYDCEKAQAGRIYSLMGAEECPNSLTTNITTSTETSYTIYQESEFHKGKVRECKVRRVQKAWYCRRQSGTSVIFRPNFSVCLNALLKVICN